MEARPAILQFSVTTVGWQTITGQTPTIDDVVARISRYSLRQIMSIVGRITLIVNQEVAGEKGEAHFDRQFRVAKMLLGEPSANALIDLVRQREGSEFKPGGFALFHERQTLNALKLACLTLDIDAPDPKPVSGVEVVEALLMLNDLIEPTASMGANIPGGQEAMELYVSANTLFNQSPALLRDLVRAHHLYVEPRPEISVRGAIDVPAALARAAGMNAETVWRALFALYAFWGGRSESELEAGSIAVSRREYLATLRGLSDAERELWFKLATWEAPELQARIRCDYSLNSPRYWDVLPFEERPLVAFGDLLLCASLPLLQRLPGRSLQHRLHDRNVFSEAETRRFRDTRGYLVERYTLDTLSRAFGSRFIPEQELKKYAGGASVCDGIVVYPYALILIECKTTSPLLDTRHATNYVTYRKQWGDTMKKAATQIDSTIALLRAGAFSALGLDASTSWELFPVVSVFEQPVQPLTYRTIRDIDLAGHPLSEKMASGDVRPLQLLSIEEVETWEIAAEQGRSVLDLLREKTSNTENIELSFHHFIVLKGEAFQNNHSGWMAARYRDTIDATMDYFRGLGLREGGDDDKQSGES